MHVLLFSNSNLLILFPLSIVSSTNGSACEIISSAVRLRTKPLSADAQNLHPHAQPTCVLIQSVFLVSPSSVGASSRTHSTNFPSESSKRYFFVSSAELLSPTSLPAANSKFSASHSFRFFGIEGKPAGEKTLCLYTASKTCAARNLGKPASARIPASASLERL